MAYTTGTASNYLDLLSILTTFAAANGWTVLAQSGTEVYLRGEGSEGLDEIFCGIRAFENAAAGYYNWQIYGSINWRAERSIGSNPVSNAGSRTDVYATFWNSAIPYWIVANARRVILVAKIGTVYSHVYFGFIDQAATTEQYSYPLFIGGTTGDSVTPYTSADSKHAAYWSGNGYNTDGYCQGALYLPAGPWGSVGYYADSGVSATTPGCKAYSLFHNARAAILSAPDGSYMLEPIFIRYAHASNIYGQLSGIYRVSGYNNTSENIITVGGVNYLVFHDTYHLGYGDFCAVEMA